MSAQFLNVLNFGYKPQEIGFRPGLNFSDYLASDGISNSMLGRAVTWQHFRAYLENPDAQKETEALRFGRWCHQRILTPEEVKAIVTPETYPATAKGEKKPGDKKAPEITVNKPWNWNANYCKEWRKEKQAEGLEVISPEDDKKTLAMGAAVFSHPFAASLLTELKTREASLFANLAFDGRGYFCKMRADVVPVAALADYKTTQDASPEGFCKSAANYGYHRQATLYRFIWNSIFPGGEKGKRARRDDFFFIAQEKEPPFAVAVYRMTDEAFEVGYAELCQRFEIINRALTIKPEEKNAAAYGCEAMPLDLPQWHIKQVAERVA